MNRHSCFVIVCIAALSAAGVADVSSNASAIVDTKIFQQASAEPSDVAYARAMNEQRAMRAEAEAHVATLQQMSFQKIREALLATGAVDAASESIGDTSVMAGAPATPEHLLENTSLHPLHVGFVIMLCALVGLLLARYFKKQ